MFYLFLTYYLRIFESVVPFHWSVLRCMGFFSPLITLLPTLAISIETPYFSRYSKASLSLIWYFSYSILFPLCVYSIIFLLWIQSPKPFTLHIPTCSHSFLYHTEIFQGFCEVFSFLQLYKLLNYNWLENTRTIYGIVVFQLWFDEVWRIVTYNFDIITFFISYIMRFRIIISMDSMI